MVRRFTPTLGSFPSPLPDSARRPLATFALLATSIVSRGRPELRERLRTWRAERTAEVLEQRDVTITGERSRGDDPQLP